MQTELTLYGLENHLCTIDRIIQELGIEPYSFDVKLILVEAITNAFYHGNGGDGRLPIHIRCSLDEDGLHIQVEDCGDGSKPVMIPEELNPSRLLDEGGRGLYLIRCFCDSVELVQNTLHISKRIELV
ncbi:ATP-binding protein [Gorillibacterium timonense]|uniref:ATP-binding protein n=1 Tax=Gorillibacterium timonense TaxID=1689269 RepID=UPI00071D345A|nr:ATP-binding protein [Gorillibacterium timonense]